MCHLSSVTLPSSISQEVPEGTDPDIPGAHLLCHTGGPHTGTTRGQAASCLGSPNRAPLGQDTRLIRGVPPAQYTHGPRVNLLPAHPRVLEPSPSEPGMNAVYA